MIDWWWLLLALGFGILLGAFLSHLVFLGTAIDGAIHAATRSWDEP